MKKAVSVWFALSFVFILFVSSASARVFYIGDIYYDHTRNPSFGTDPYSILDYPGLGSPIYNGTTLFDYSWKTGNIAPGGSLVLLSIYNFTDAISDLSYYVYNRHGLYETYEYEGYYTLDNIFFGVKIDFKGDAVSLDLYGIGEAPRFPTFMAVDYRYTSGDPYGPGPIDGEDYYRGWVDLVYDSGAGRYDFVAHLSLYPEGYNPPSPTPEPATVLLMGAGLLGMLGMRRRFKK